MIGDPVNDTMTRSPASTASQFRIAGWLGVIGMVGVLFNAARRSGIVPENALTHAMAPPAAALGIIGLMVLYLYQRERAGTLGMVGFGINLIGLVGLFGIEYTTHAIFQFLEQAEITALLDEGARPYFLAVAITFLTGVVLFSISMLRAKALPAPAVVLYLIGFATASLRGIVPDLVYVSGLVVGASATIWLLVAMISAVRTPAAARTR
jgi:hypothetical protein